ncbi:hypothetical protein ES703_108091 [subsurface metagenome]
MLHGVDNVRFGEYGAAGSNEGRFSRKAGCAPGQFGSRKIQPLRLLFDKGAGACGAGRVDQMFFIFILIKKNEGEGLPADRKHVSAAGNQKLCPLYERKSAVDQSPPAALEIPGNPDQIVGLKLGSGKNCPQRGLNVAFMFKVLRLQEAVVSQERTA